MQLFECDILHEKCYHFTHASGMRFYIVPKEISTCNCTLTVQYGADDFSYLKGQEDITLPLGTAHFLEHKMFEGENGEDLSLHFTDYGMDCNAYTTHTQTTYTFSGAGDVKSSIKELLNMVLHAHFTDASVEKEQSIINDEIRRTNDNPVSHLHNNLNKALYLYCPVKYEILGTFASLRNITPEVLMQAHRDFYNPSNMIFVICGNVDPNDVETIANEILPSEEKAFETIKKQYDEPKKVAEKILVDFSPVSMPLVSIGFKDIERPSDPQQALRRDTIIGYMLSILFSESSKEIEKLREEGYISSEYSANYVSENNYATLYLKFESNCPDEAIQLMQDIIRNAIHNGIANEDFERYKRVLFAQETRCFDSPEYICDITTSNIIENCNPFEDYTMVASIQKEEIEAVLPTIFNEECMSISIIKPYHMKKANHEEPENA